LADFQITFPASQQQITLVKGGEPVDDQPSRQGHRIVAILTAGFVPALLHALELGRGEQSMAPDGIDGIWNTRGNSRKYFC
jgi:hypothetical protein